MFLVLSKPNDFILFTVHYFSLKFQRKVNKYYDGILGIGLIKNQMLWLWPIYHRVTAELGSYKNRINNFNKYIGPHPLLLQTELIFSLSRQKIILGFHHMALGEDLRVQMNSKIFLFRFKWENPILDPPIHLSILSVLHDILSKRRSDIM